MFLRTNHKAGDRIFDRNDSISLPNYDSNDYSCCRKKLTPPTCLYRRVHKIAEGDRQVRHVSFSFCHSVLPFFSLTVHLVVHPHVSVRGTTRLPVDRFSCNFTSEDFKKSVEKIRF